MGKPKRKHHARLLTTTKSHTPQYTFLDLPAELRNRVYEYAVADALTFLVRSGKLVAKHGLGASCKQVRAEFLSMVDSEEYGHLPRKFESRVHNLNFRQLLEDIATVEARASRRAYRNGIMAVTMTFDDKFDKRLASYPVQTRAFQKLDRTGALPREYRFDLAGYTHCVGRIDRINGRLVHSTEWREVAKAYSDGLVAWKVWIWEVDWHRALGKIAV